MTQQEKSRLTPASLHHQLPLVLISIENPVISGGLGNLHFGFRKIGIRKAAQSERAKKLAAEKWANTTPEERKAKMAAVRAAKHSTPQATE